MLSVAQAGAGHARDAPWDTGRSENRLARTRPLWAAKHCLYRAGESDVRHRVAALACHTWATAKPAPQLLIHLEWWRAYYHFVRPHASRRVALVQPRERSGKRLAQRNRQRTPAMAAGRTNRRWTAGEMLCYPLPPVPFSTS